MAKGIGLIGNFRGKVGNMVGYNLKDSNNKQTQGVRVYQPIVKNPKTYGQAEQRAKLAPINATYRALKMIIDRGQEGKAYGNKSRLAWLSAAMKAFNGGWFEKGAAITLPAIVPLTKGSLPELFEQDTDFTCPQINLSNEPSSAPTTIGAMSSILLAEFSALHEGDQLTFVRVDNVNSSIVAKVESLVIDTTNTEALPSFVTFNTDQFMFLASEVEAVANAIIVSREGDNGQHLRSSTPLYRGNGYDYDTMSTAAKEAAIKSYMTGGSNTDWAEESLQG